MKIQIKSWLNSSVLFEHDCDNNTIRLTLEAAVKVGASLYGASLDRASLYGAKLNSKETVSKSDRPLLEIGPIGSRSSRLRAWITDKGMRIQAGCFWGTIEEFTAKVEATHSDNEHGQEYRAAIELVKVHAKLWEAK